MLTTWYNYYPCNKWINPTCVSTARGIQSYAECNCTKNNACSLLSLILGIITSDWLQHAHSVRGVYELGIITCLAQRHNTSTCVSNPQFSFHEMATSTVWLLHFLTSNIRRLLWPKTVHTIYQHYPSGFIDAGSELTSIILFFFFFTIVTSSYSFGS